MFSYKELDKEYLTNRMEVLMIAMEADGVDAGANAPSGSIKTEGNEFDINKRNKIWKVIEQIFSKILIFIEEKIKRLSINIKRVFETSYGFDKALANAKKAKKPLQNHLKIIKYQYNNQFLEQSRKAVDSVIVELTNQANNYRELLEKKDSPLMQGASMTESYILEQCRNRLPQAGNDTIYKDEKGNPIDNNPPSTGNPEEDAKNLEAANAKEENNRAKGSANILRFLHYIRNHFHGNKTTILVNTADVGQYEQVCENTKGIGKIVDGQLRRLQILIRNINGKIKADMRSMQDDTEKSQMLSNIARSLHSVTNFYSTFYDYYLDLRYEEMFAAREVVKRVYQF